MYNATEALGGAYGKTFGSYLGLGSGFQAAQNQANGGVYGITGGVLNMAGAGQGRVRRHGRADGRDDRPGHRAAWC